jgi:membrane protein implicated in regulation of membrane protease activity
MKADTRTRWRDGWRVGALTLVALLALPAIAVLFFVRAALLVAGLAALAAGVMAFAFSLASGTGCVTWASPSFRTRARAGHRRGAGAGTRGRACRERRPAWA